MNARNTEAYPGLPQACTMDTFASIVNSKKSTIVAKLFILSVFRSSIYTYEVVMEPVFGQNIVVSISDALRDLVSFSTI